MKINANDILMKKYSSNIDKLAKEAKSVENGKNKKIDDKGLKKACKDFESFFINYMLKEMRKTVPKYDIVPETNAKKIFESMFYEKISDRLADRGGIGIANMIYENIKQENFSK